MRTDAPDIQRNETGGNSIIISYFNRNMMRQANQGKVNRILVGKQARKESPVAASLPKLEHYRPISRKRSRSVKN